jgi:hypothetical protein
MALLAASPSTTQEWDIESWKVLRGSEQGVILAVDHADRARWRLRIEGEPESTAFRVRSLDDDTTATLSPSGEVLESTSATIAGLASALFRDARQPLDLIAAAHADDERVGLQVGALSGVRDSGEVAYAGSGCTAKTDVFFDSAGFDSRTTVVSPYLFTGCWVRIDLTLYLESGVVETQSYKAMACAVWDSSCPARKQTNYPSNASGPIRDIEIGYYAPGNGTTRF